MNSPRLKAVLTDGDSDSEEPKKRRHSPSGEMREVVRKLLTDPAYQADLRHRLLLGELPPQLEIHLWNYAFGRPPESVKITTDEPAVKRVEIVVIDGSMKEPELSESLPPRELRTGDPWPTH